MPRSPSPEREFLVRALRPQAGLGVGLLVLQALGSAAALAVPYLAKVQIDLLEGRHPALFSTLRQAPWTLFLYALLLIAAAGLARTLLRVGFNFADLRFQRRASIALEKRLFERLATFDAGFLQNPRNRRILNAIYDITDLGSALMELVRGGIDVLVVTLGALPIVARVDAKVFAVLAVASALQGLLVRWRMQRDNAFRLLGDRVNGRVNELRWLLYHDFPNILNAGGTDRVFSQYWQLLDERFDLDRRKQRVRGGFDLGDWVAENLGTIGVAALAGAAVLAGHATIGSFTMLTLYAGQIQRAFDQLLDILQRSNEVRMTLARLGFFLRLRPRISFAAVTRRDGLPEGDLVLEDVRFGYPSFTEEERAYLRHIVARLGKSAQSGRGRFRRELQEWEQVLEDATVELPEVLHGVSCRVARGEVTALVGRNGSGKSTLVSLCLRNYDPSSGSMRIGGVEMTTVHPHDLHHAVAHVAQHPFVLESFSIRENLTIGATRDIPDSEAWRTLEDLEVAAAVRALPRGLDSVIGDEVRLSGGQSQLLVIARALLQQRPFVLLDEGTNQLDAEHEAKVANALRGLRAHAAVLLITHRMTTARKADRIYVLDQGRIVQQGRHADLVEADGLYQAFWNLQVVE